MRYYISWTHSDAIYQTYFPDIAVLVSPPSVNLAWTVYEWPQLPRQLMLDSGAFQYQKEGKMIEPDRAFARQLQMLAGAEIPTQFCHFDVPMLGAQTQHERQQRVSQNLRNAQWLLKKIQLQPLSRFMTPIGVIQGYDEMSIYHSARQLADMGYTTFALGSLVPFASRNMEEAIRRIETAIEAIGINLHILGISSVTIMRKIIHHQLRSFDSSSPITESWKGGIFYSAPFRRYKIPSPNLKEWARTYKWAEILEAPLACDCPICQQDPQIIMSQQGKLNINKRAVHNCYHLSREFDNNFIE